MTYVRQNAWTISKNEGTWADAFMWYARAVADMQQRTFTDLTSWRFYAAIHGFREDKWSAFGYFREGETLPGDSDVKQYWKQCQHGTWYFLPWHRGYLLTFEAIVRAAIVRLGGPNTWALPYWNYFADGEADIPPAFASRTMPDGKVNPLYVQARYGPNNDGNVSIPMDQVSLEPLSDYIFVGTFNHGATGFGGPITRFSHSGGYHGGLETQPHDMVHVCIGGFPPQAGLMSDPVTAALDPIFWLHHANVDRLWEVWLNNSSAHSNPTDSHWLGGPVTYGDQKFSTPDANGAPYDYTPAAVVDLSVLGYRYDDLSSPVPPAVSLKDRIQQLGGSASRILNLPREEVMSRLTEPELVGSNRRSISIAGSDPTVTEVSVSRTPRNQLSRTLNQAMSLSLPDRVFLNLENVTGLLDGSRFRVLISDPAANRSDAYMAGTIGLFGVSSASEADGKHAGQGISYSFDITEFVDSLQLQNELNADQLHVTIVPLVPVPEKAQIRVGRVSIYRQPQSLNE